MLLANKNNQRTRASPNSKAICPLCNEEVIAKCGEIKIWHWAHKVNFTCKEFEPETERHIEMKLFFKDNFPNFELEYNLGWAIPDLFDKNRKIAIEVQHSRLSKEKFLERTINYRKNGIHVLWIFDCFLLKENVPDFLRKAHELYFGRIYIYHNKNITPLHFKRKERVIKINTDFCDIIPEYYDEAGNEFITSTYKLKREFYFGNEIIKFNLILVKNNWKENDYLIARFTDRKFW